MQLALPVTRIVAEAAVVGGDDRRQPRRRCSEREARPDAIEIVGAAFDSEQGYMRRARLGQQHVDDAVHGVGTVQGVAGSPNHLDRGGEFGAGLEQRVDVAEAGRPRGDAVFEEQERAAGPRSGEYG